MMGASRALAPVVAVALLAGPTLAQPKEPSAKDKELAGDLVKKAIAKSQAGEHAAAIDIYLQAYTIVPNSLLLSNIGSEFQQSNKPIEALRYFCMYLEKDPTGTNAPYAQSQAHAIQMQLGNKVDEKNVCAKKVEPKIVEKPVTEPPKPVVEPPVKPVEQPGQPIDTGEKQHTTGGTLRWVGVGAGVIGLAAIGGGIFYGIRAQQISDQITNHDKMMAWPDDIQKLEQQGQDYENYQIGLLIGGGVAVAAGVVMYVVGGPKPVAEQPSIAVLPTSNGFAVSGRF